MKVLKLRVPIYERSVTILLGCDAEAANKKMGWSGVFDGNRSGMLVWTDDYQLALWVMSEWDIGTICHEAIHLANRILIDAGVKLNGHNDEPLAYLTQWIVEQIVNEV